jgi:hypothetical protein
MRMEGTVYANGEADVSNSPVGYAVDEDEGWEPSAGKKWKKMERQSFGAEQGDGRFGGSLIDSLASLLA